MKMSLSIDIEASTQAVWDVIADIENAADRIRGINSLEVLEPATGPSIVGLKWKETRTFAGRDATETMWITAAEEPSYYDTRAESHGSIYQTRMSVDPTSDGAGSRLTMTFEGTPQTFGAKLLWALTGWMATKPMKKALTEDLEDIKKAAEA
ncbi:MAG: SRPBCC family protein [Thermoplasmatota archaeon]